MQQIEKSAFRKGEYVGYGGNDVWTIYGQTGSWHAYSRYSKMYLPARTLKELDEKLGELPTGKAT